MTSESNRLIDAYMKGLASPGVHEQKVRELWGEAAFYRGDKPVFDSPLYLVGFMNRSGSNLLCEYLTSTKKLRGLQEQLNHPVITNFAEKHAITSFPDYIRKISELGRPLEAPYGFKASTDQLVMLHRLGITAMYPEVRVIHILRQDVLGQAVSLQIAWQTNQWTSRQTPESNHEPVFRGQALSRMVQQIGTSNVAFPILAHTFGAAYAQVFYEDLVQDPKASVERVARMVGLDIGDWTPPPPQLEKQAGEINERFRQRYGQLLLDAVNEGVSTLGA